MDFRIGIVALGFLIDFDGFVDESNGAGNFGLGKSSQECRVFCGAR